MTCRSCIGTHLQHLIVKGGIPFSAFPSSARLQRHNVPRSLAMLRAQEKRQRGQCQRQHRLQEHVQDHRLALEHVQCLGCSWQAQLRLQAGRSLLVLGPRGRFHWRSIPAPPPESLVTQPNEKQRLSPCSHHARCTPSGRHTDDCQPSLGLHL